MNRTPNDDGTYDWCPFALSKSTAVGYKVSLAATLELLKYLRNECNYSYIMTSRLTSDPIEVSCFGKYFFALRPKSATFWPLR